MQHYRISGARTHAREHVALEPEPASAQTDSATANMCGRFCTKKHLGTLGCLSPHGDLLRAAPAHDEAAARRWSEAPFPARENACAGTARTGTAAKVKSKEGAAITALHELCS